MRDQTRFTLRDGMDLSGLRLIELWWRYVAIGGHADQAQLAEWVMGRALCPADDHDVIAQALNESFLDRGLNTFPVGYSDAMSAPAFSGRPRTAAADRPIATGTCARSVEVRRQAADARLRSAMAAHRAVMLHASAARLMQVNGQLQMARQARERAERARARETGWNTRVA
jgi:hypothetical protein